MVYLFALRRSSGDNWLRARVSVTLFSHLSTNKKNNKMVLTLFSIWACAIATGTVGASAALSGRWGSVLAAIVVAGVLSIALFLGLKGEFAVSLIEAGDIYIWIAMLGPVVMWAILAAGSSFSVWRRRIRMAAT
jgi:hypothetical protein